ncbi:MAG: family 20 glycosylhydrolase, partial [Rhodospirillaceae bacterium]|nr:family 20 glycosylhydrolase [Rhodospirillaceae bacterium]
MLRPGGRVGGWSAALWVKRTGDTVQSSLFSPPSGGPGSGLVKLEMHGSSNEVGLTVHDGTKFVDYNFGYSVPRGVWVHLVFVGGSASTALYVNGSLFGELMVPLDLPLDRIGARYGGHQPVDALLDEVNVYDKRLAASEVATLYRSYGINAEPKVVPRLRSWSGAPGGVKLSASSRILLPRGDINRHWSADFFSTVLGGLADPDKVGLSDEQEQAARLALADSRHAIIHHTSSRQTLLQVAQKIHADIKDVTGLHLSVVSGDSASARAGDIVVDLLDAADANLSTEGYRFSVDEHVLIQANSTTGVFYGSRTLLQVLRLSDDGVTVPAGVAVDWPTASQDVRMIHYDMGRKYWEPSYLKDSIRQMSWNKLNTLYFHLNESPAFRLHDPSAYSGLAPEIGRYAKSDIDALEAIAAEHHIAIIPGIDVPSHASSISQHFNIGFDGGGNPACNAANRPTGYTIDLTDPAAIKTVQDLAVHFAKWFSGPYFAIGGDEVPDDVQTCSKGRSYINSEAGIANAGDLLVRFINGMNAKIRDNAQKRTLIFSNYENKRPNLSLDSNVVVLPWEDEEHVWSHDTINIRWHSDHLYLQMGTWGFNVPDSELHRSDAFPAEHAGELGSGIAVWLDYNFWAADQLAERHLHRPRAVLADRTWNDTPTSGDLASFHQRMDAVGDPPGFVGYKPPARSVDFSLNRYYTFDDLPWPTTHHTQLGAYDHRTGSEPVVDDVGGYHGSTDAVLTSRPNRDDRKAGITAPGLLNAAEDEFTVLD